MTWDRNWLLVKWDQADDVEKKLVAAGLVSGNDFLVRRPGWNSIDGKRIRNGSLTAFLFTGDGSGAVLAKMILE
jgi:hypothetical protein